MYMATMIVETFSMDYTSAIHFAQRPDGQWFTRSQYRDARYGYKWTAWRPVPYGPDKGRATGQVARLPKGGQ